ncbi:hypothetical protein [Streptomyces sp. NPDC000880]
MSNHRPGEWPVTTPIPLDEPSEDRQGTVAAERARFHLTLGSIRADLEEQPSEPCVRAAARRWQQAITALADDTLQQLRKTG